MAEAADISGFHQRALFCLKQAGLWLGKIMLVVCAVLLVFAMTVTGRIIYKPLDIGFCVQLWKKL